MCSSHKALGYWYSNGFATWTVAQRAAAHGAIDCMKTIFEQGLLRKAPKKEKQASSKPKYIGLDVGRKKMRQGKVKV